MTRKEQAAQDRLTKALQRAKLDQRGPREALTAIEWQRVNMPGTAAGRPKAGQRPKLSAEFQRRQRTLSAVDRGVSSFRRSKWVGDLSHSNRPLGETLDAIQARVVASPDKTTLRECQIVLNDLARLSGGSEEISARLTQDVVDHLISPEA